MRVNNTSFALIHGICITAIVLLTAFIVWEKTNDQDESVQSEWQFALGVGAVEINKINHDLLASIEKEALEYRSENNISFYNRAQKVVADADSMLLLIDSLQQKTNPALLYEVQGKLSVFCSKLWKISDFEPTVKSELDYFPPTDWLFQLWKNGSQQQFSTVLKKTIAEVRVAEWSALYDIVKKSYNPIGGNYRYSMYEPQICFDQIAPAVGDSVTATILLSYPDVVDKCVMRLNGLTLPVEKGKAKFQVRYEQPGIYPLHFSVEQKNFRADSIETWEKTYYLKVR